MASTPEAAKSTGTWPRAWTASVCTGIPCAAAIATTSSIGCTVPTSLLAHMTETSGTEPGSRSTEARSASTSSRPSAVDRQQLDLGPLVLGEPAQRVEHGVVLDRRWHRMRVRRGSAARRAQKMPFTARLSDSVPPEVKTTSPGRQFERLRDRLPGLLDDPASVAARGVQRAGVADRRRAARSSPRSPRAASAWWPRGRGRRRAWGRSWRRPASLPHGAHLRGLLLRRARPEHVDDGDPPAGDVDPDRDRPRPGSRVPSRCSTCCTG